MKYIATFDVGTTAVKGVLVDETGAAHLTKSVDIPTLFCGDFKEQAPEDWYQAFLQITKCFTEQYSADSITGVIMSGQMQDVIPLDRQLRPLGNAILYSDGRAEAQAAALEQAVGAQRLEAITGNHCDGSLPIPKLMWLREQQPERFAGIFKVLISSKDYLIARLTGVCAGDYTACSTAGGMDIHQKCWSSDILAAADLSPDLLPALYASHSVVGSVHEQAARECGLAVGTPVYAGVGDAGATTLASGIDSPGQYNINLGTSGWVATVSDDVLHISGGVFNLAAMQPDCYINVVPFLNAGNVHKWISGILAQREDGTLDYDAVGQLLARSTPGSGGVLFLPYLLGERFPVLDPDVKGCYVSLTPTTSRCDMARACLEGVAFSIRQGIEAIGRPPRRVTVIGGGAKETAWCQILADVIRQEVHVYKGAQELPAMALASAVMLEQGIIESYGQFTASLQSPDRCVVYTPDPAHAALYNEAFARYLKLYPAIRMLENK